MEEPNNKKYTNSQTQAISADTKELSRNQLIFYIIILSGTITIFILSMLGINLFMLLIIIGIVLVYVYFDDDIVNDIPLSGKERQEKIENKD
ncbi:MAG: hypothetical protein GF383_13835 [Candidatus Lokiarchaeota archaeon]|nr:hypothetical protein [Candidatus Lokiarchaeota archaeon]MBD3342346.1 hypothetical protein [Candidatus Lokiarchaeota archaeon]